MISRPTLIVQESIVKKNLQRLHNKAQKSGVSLAPHFKTHQSKTIGKWAKEFGVEEITVSSISMAEYFASDWNKIIVAFPVNVLEIDTINTIAKTCALTLLVQSEEVIIQLQQKLKNPVSLLIDIDPGYGRTGILPKEKQLISNLMDCCKQSKKTNIRGFYAHAGQSYYAKSKKDIQNLYGKNIDDLAQLQSHFGADLDLIYGDTPSCSLAENFEKLNCISAGNYFFYDLTQHHIGSCALQDIAIATICPVVIVNKDKNTVVIHGGGIHFSKDHLNNTFGVAYHWDGRTWDLNRRIGVVTGISQEHGTIQLEQNFSDSITTGDIIAVLPVHSCMMADCMREYYDQNWNKIDHFNYKANP